MGSIPPVDAFFKISWPVQPPLERSQSTCSRWRLIPNWKFDPEWLCMVR
jgi:hypothetical protein